MSPFASITADILARKGEARPWNSFGTELAKETLAWEPPPRIEQAFAAPVAPPPDVQYVLEAEAPDSLIVAPPPKVQHAVMPQVGAPQAVAPQAVAPQAVVPQAVVPQAVAPQPAVAPPRNKPAVVAAVAHDVAGDLRKYTVKISHHDYERLGILAVKQGKSRQRLLQETVNSLFADMAEDYGASCQCLGKCG